MANSCHTQDNPTVPFLGDKEKPRLYSATVGMHREDGNKMNKQKGWERNMGERRKGERGKGMETWKNIGEGTVSKGKERENIGGEEL